MESYLDSKTTIEETVKLLPKQVQEDIKYFFEKTKTNPKWYATYNFKYTYNGLGVYRLNFSKPDIWRINFTLAKPDKLNDVLMTIHDELRTFFICNLRKCKHCNPKHGNGGRFIILDNEYFVCAEPEIEIENPSISDVDMLCKFFEIRKNIIKEIKATK
ncbi:MAG: hypothetical protein BGN88_09970 [Clostridiales bacterium 43-6]|nr:MAG: hypothetical protein BGN88_09970 [Clostridiales bacterium 43-6]